MGIFGNIEKGLIFTNHDFEFIGGLQYIKRDDNSYFVNNIEVIEKYQRLKYGSLLHKSFQVIVRRNKGYSIKGRIDVENTRSLEFHRKFGFTIIPNFYGSESEFHEIEYNLY